MALGMHPTSPYLRRSQVAPTEWTVRTLTCLVYNTGRLTAVTSIPEPADKADDERESGRFGLKRGGEVSITEGVAARSAAASVQ
jgi:hypothetical protein